VELLAPGVVPLVDEAMVVVEAPVPVVVGASVDESASQGRLWPLPPCSDAPPSWPPEPVDTRGGA
jgi:hypothetical protein